MLAKIKHRIGWQESSKCNRNHSECKCTRLTSQDRDIKVNNNNNKMQPGRPTGRNRSGLMVRVVFPWLLLVTLGHLLLRSRVGPAGQGCGCLCSWGRGQVSRDEVGGLETVGLGEAAGPQVPPPVCTRTLLMPSWERLDVHSSYGRWHFLGPPLSQIAR